MMNAYFVFECVDFFFTSDMMDDVCLVYSNFVQIKYYSKSVYDSLLSLNFI